MTRAIPFLESPLILAPIAGPGSAALTAAAAEAGIFAFLASAYSDEQQMRDDVAAIRARTSQPFGINLFIEAPLPAISVEKIEEANARLDVYRDELGIPHQSSPAMPVQRYAEQLNAVLDARPQAFSFTFGIPRAEELHALRDAGIYTIGTATCVDEALALEHAGVDAVFAQGAEAGGHRGSFLNAQAPPLMGTIALVPLVVDAVRLPVIAAGGICDGRGVAAALALGASAVALGTAFLRATEAQTSAAYRRALATAQPADTTITAAFSGRYARGIANRMSRELEDPSTRAPYPYQNALTRDIRNAAARQGNDEYLSLWAGQGFPLARDGAAAEIIARILKETSAALDAARDRLKDSR